jgi:short-chain fatty acids transporter
MLLPFTMQMTLVLLLGCVLASTPLFRKLVVSISQLPRTQTQVIIASVLCVAAISYLNWGLALALGPIIAVHLQGGRATRIPIDFPFLLAVNGGAGSVWQFGLRLAAIVDGDSRALSEGSTGTMSLCRLFGLRRRLRWWSRFRLR